MRAFEIKPETDVEAGLRFYCGPANELARAFPSLGFLVRANQSASSFANALVNAHCLGE